MLIASELFEAIEGLRENNFNPSLDESRETIKASCACEMADAYIRVLDFMEYEGIYAISYRIEDEFIKDPAEEIFSISKLIHMDGVEIKILANYVCAKIERFCQMHKIDLMAFVEWKLAYNLKREYKHGKEF